MAAPFGQTAHAPGTRPLVALACLGEALAIRRQALGDLVTLYTAWGKPEKAAALKK